MEELATYEGAVHSVIFQNAETAQQLCAVDNENGVLVTLPPFSRGWDIATVFVE